jgi:hypothetical protein
VSDKGEAGANRSGKTEIQIFKMRKRKPICRRHPQIFGEIRRTKVNRDEPLWGRRACSCSERDGNPCRIESLVKNQKVRKER